MSSSSITVQQAEQLFQNERVLLVDMRDELSYRCTHLSNAINVQTSRLHLLLNNMNKSIPVILYCELGAESAEACELFLELGFDQCQYIEGGFESWMEKQKQKASPSASLCNWLEHHGFDCDDLERRAYNGETALMFAARKGECEYVVDLIDRGAQLDAINQDGNSALWLACYSNDCHTLSELIRAGANLDIQNDNGATALIYAASAGRSSMVNLLIDAGANLELKTLDDFSALEVASTAEILKRLKKAIASRHKLAS